MINHNDQPNGGYREIVPGNTLGKQKYLFCHSCKNYTHHKLRYARAYKFYVDENDDGTEYYSWDVWIIWSCDGCDSLTLEDAFKSHEWFDGQDFEDDNPRTFYPEPKTPKTFTRIPSKLQAIYEQLLEAYDNRLDLLCAIGLRSLLEGICDDRELGGTHDNLEKKIKSLTKIGVPVNIVEGLHGFRFMGNKAAHELTAPKRQDLELAIEITEDLLNFMYRLEYKVKKLLDSQKQLPKFVVTDED